jgi:hypothetical protein
VRLNSNGIGPASAAEANPGAVINPTGTPLLAPTGWAPAETGAQRLVMKKQGHCEHSRGGQDEHGGHRHCGEPHEFR